MELDRWAAESEGDTEAPLGHALQHTQRALHDIERQEQRLLDAYLLGALSVEIFKPRAATLVQQKAQAREQVLGLQRERHAREQAHALTHSALVFAADLTKVLTDAPFQVRQQILRLFIETHHRQGRPPRDPLRPASVREYRFDSLRRRLTTPPKNTQAASSPSRTADRSWRRLIQRNA